MKSFLTLLLFIGTKAMAQTQFKVDSLLEKKWKIASYDVEGHIFPATTVGINDYTIFSKDHSAKAINAGITTLSTWKFDQTKNLLTLYSKEKGISSDMKIFALDGKEFIFETTNEDGITLKVHMKSENQE